MRGTKGLFKHKLYVSSRVCRKRASGTYVSCLNDKSLTEQTQDLLNLPNLIHFLVVSDDISPGATDILSLYYHKQRQITAGQHDNEAG